MKIFKPHVVDVDIRSTEMTTFSDTHRVREITSIRLLCEGVLKDGSPVEFEIEATRQEREVLIHVFDNIMERFSLENREVDEKAKRLAGIKYEDG